jgi:hypothetical protein
MLSFIGFTAGGVAASSFASAWQSSIGNVAAGSVFAWLQGAGASGFSLNYLLPVAIVGTAIVRAKAKNQSSTTSSIQKILEG